MSCRDAENLLAGGREAEFRSHGTSCADCAVLGREIDRMQEAVGGLVPPPWSVTLRESLRAVPSRTVSCEGAALLLARVAEEPLPPADSSRLEGHLSRCDACSESSAVLGITRELESPSPSPWLATRLAAERRGIAGRSRRRLWNPRAAIAFAYAAAVVVMLIGLNPADLARQAGGRLQENARQAANSIGASAVDRFGSVQEEVFRKLAVWKGRAGGYGRAALSNALALVMKTEPRPSPSRPRSGDGSGLREESETEISTWRA